LQLKMLKFEPSLRPLHKRSFVQAEECLSVAQHPNFDIATSRYEAVSVNGLVIFASILSF